MIKVFFQKVTILKFLALTLGTQNNQEKMLI